MRDKDSKIKRLEREIKVHDIIEIYIYVFKCICIYMYIEKERDI